MNFISKSGRRLMSDTEGSDYEVILEETMEKPITPEPFQAFFNAMTPSGTTASGISSTADPSLDLNSMLRYVNEQDVSVISTAPIPVVAPQKVYVFPGEENRTAEDEEEADDSLMEAHKEIRQTLIAAIEHMDTMKTWEEEKSQLLIRVSTLEGTVERLVQKNKKLQRVNENGVSFERRRREKSLLQPIEEKNENSDEGDSPKKEEEKAPISEKKSRKLEFFLIFLYSLIIGGGMVYRQIQADNKLAALESQKLTISWDNEQLSARVKILEEKLNISFGEIQKLTALIHSPYNKDIFTIPAEDEEIQEIGCFIRFNSTVGGICQKLIDELEKELHEKMRLKGFVSELSGLANGGIALILAMSLMWLVKKCI